MENITTTNATETEIDEIDINSGHFCMYCSNINDDNCYFRFEYNDIDVDPENAEYILQNTSSTLNDIIADFEEFQAELINLLNIENAKKELSKKAITYDNMLDYVTSTINALKDN